MIWGFTSGELSGPCLVHEMRQSEAFLARRLLKVFVQLDQLVGGEEDLYLLDTKHLDLWEGVCGEGGQRDWVPFRSWRILDGAAEQRSRCSELSEN